MIRLSRREFVRLVRRAYEQVPPPVRQALHNLDIAVEEWPGQDELGLGWDKGALFGLYTGVPLPEREGGGPLLPDRIVIYRQPILRSCLDPRRGGAGDPDNFTPRSGPLLGYGGRRLAPAGIWLIKQWNPPEELQEFHEVRIRALETSAKLLEDSGILELMREFEKAAEEEDGDRMLELMGEMAELEDVGQELEDKMEELAEEIERTGEGLSPATRQILEDADCISF